MINFNIYEEDCNEAWICELYKSWDKIYFQIKGDLKKPLSKPIFSINPNINGKWGSWSPSKRIMTFSSKLLRNFEWGAVEYVMKHEMCHQIVSEVFDMDCYGVSHGEFFGLACEIMGIDNSRCTDCGFLSSFKGKDSNPLINKIKKLMNHSSDKAVTEAESELFMNKAQQLMLKYDIDMKDIRDGERVFVKRPFGGLYKSWKSYMWTLGSLLNKHYDVECIRTYSNINGKSRSRLELYGEPDKLDIAEYVGYAILNQGKILYKEFKKQRAKENKERGYSYGKISECSFMKGLINGYKDKLDKEREINEKTVEKEYGEIIPLYNKGLLDEMYKKAYPNLRMSHSSGSYGGGYGEGQKAGSKLKLGQGLHNNGNRGKLIGC